MIKFKKRSSQKTTIPGKPIPTGFKLFVLADSGYILDWEATKPGLAEGVLKGKKRISVSILNTSIFIFLNPTQSVVIRLIFCLALYI
jgi:hypothetical protein